MDARLILTKLIVLSLSLFYGLLAVASCLFSWILHVFNFVRVKNRPLPPPCLLDDSLGRHGYAKLKDLTLHYVENGDRSKPLMLCLHGFPEFWYSWRFQLREFSSTHWVVAIDLRGYGDSDKPVGKSAYRLRHLVEDVKELLPVLGRQKIDVLMAHDWGGALAYSFTAKYPDLVDKLIVMNCPHPVAFRQVLMKSLKQLKMSWYMFMFQLPFIPEILLRMNDLDVLNHAFRKPEENENRNVITDEDIEAYKYVFSRRGAFTAPLNYYRTNIISDINTEGIPNRIIENPTLLVWGTADVALSEETADRTKQFVKNLTLRKLDGVTHWVQQDSPVQVNKLVSEFLGIA